jgi:hypothetical protein
MSVTAYLTADHQALHELLEASLRGDFQAFERFRAKLLRHIGIEEKLVFREAKKRGPFEEAHGLRVEHAALTSLLVGTPDIALVREIAGLIEGHDRREEGGLYARCEALIGEERSAELEVLARNQPEVPVLPHDDGARVPRTAEAALASARRIRPS